MAKRRLAAVFIVAVVSLWSGVAGAQATPPPDMFTATAGVTFSDFVGGYTTTNCGPDGCQIFNPNVTIDWGDGVKTPVRATPTCPSCDTSDWEIKGTHTYRLPGRYAASFSGVVAGQDVPIAATVNDDPNSITPAAETLTPVVGAPFSDVLVATFADSNSLAKVSDFTASITWGDRTQSAGTVQAIPGGGFEVLGGHTYSRVGGFPIGVTLQHLDNTGAPTGASATAPSQADVLDAVLTGAASPITAVVGAPFAGPVASFSDPNPFAMAADFTATITWGDGVTSPGTVSAAPSGFLITGSHTFGSAGQIPVSVHVADSQGSTTTIQARALVSPAPPPPRTTVTLAPGSPTGSHGWYRGPVHASVTATSPTGAIVATRCQLDGVAPGSFDALPGGCPFANGGADITADGAHALYAASINDAGQKERPTGTSIAIDATPPAVRCSSVRPILRTGTVGALVKATVTDRTSGPASQTVAVPAATSTPGPKTARLTGSDNAGNAATRTCRYLVLGQIDPSLIWGFNSDGATTQVGLLVAGHLPPKATIRVLCHGAGCRAASRVLRAGNKRACRGKSCRRAAKRNQTTVDLTGLLHGWRLHVGTVLEVAIGERDAIGRGFVFTMRNGRIPSEVAGCLAPGSLIPDHGC